MSKQASQFQKKVMSLGYRGKEIFKPLNTGWIEERMKHGLRGGRSPQADR